MKKHYYHSNRKRRFAQAAAVGILIGSLTIGLIRPGAEAVDGGFDATFEGDTPVAVGALVIPGKAAEPETEPERVEQQRLFTDEEIFAMKWASWEEKKAAEKERPEPLYTEDDLRLLAITIYCEAGSDSISDETRRMVGEVVLNRMADNRFPDSIEGVLTQRSQYGRFYWTGVVLPSRAASEPEAVERAYDCARMVFTEERLLPTDVVFQAEFVQGEIVASAPGFYFCR